MAERILLSFKDNEIDRELAQFLKEEAKLIGPSAYMKQLLYEKMLSRRNKKSPTEK